MTIKEKALYIFDNLSRIEKRLLFRRSIWDKEHIEELRQSELQMLIYNEERLIEDLTRLGLLK